MRTTISAPLSFFLRGQSRALAFFRRYHFQNVIAVGNYCIAVHLQHVEEKLIVLIGRELLVAVHRDFTLHMRINDNGFMQVFTDNIDEFTNIGIFKRRRKAGSNHTVCCVIWRWPDLHGGSCSFIASKMRK